MEEEKILQLDDAKLNNNEESLDLDKMEKEINSSYLDKSTKVDVDKLIINISIILGVFMVLITIYRGCCKRKVNDSQLEDKKVKLEKSGGKKQSKEGKSN